MENKNSSGRSRNILAYITLGVSALAIAILAGYAIHHDEDNAMTIFNVTLPVFASWVGTVLAFYFGREHFESANQQVRQLVDRLTPEQRAQAPVSSIMRPIEKTVCFEFPAGGNETTIKVSELRAKFTDKVTRLPVVDAQKVPRYMIHESAFDRYKASGGKSTHTLEAFLKQQKAQKHEFGLNKGFVVVSETATLAMAKMKMDAASPCQDIFVTKQGSPDEPLTGWISNIRMAKFLEA